MTAKAATSIELDRYLTSAGAAAETFARLWDSVWRQPHVPVDLLELCRLNFARLHRDDIEMAAPNPKCPGLSEERRTAVLDGSWPDSQHLSQAEKVALLLSDYYWMDAQSITDEAAADVVAHFGESGFVMLIEAFGCIDGRMRTAKILRDLAAANSTKETSDVR